MVFAFNRQGELLQIEVNNTDYLFKLALLQKNLAEVKEILSTGNLCGHSIVGYLKEQGHAEIALFFEKDLRQRFNLALASGNIHVAFEAAKEIKEKDNFMRLAQTAILLGNLEITEKCYQFVRSLDKLNFFYAATGSV
jgi:coatomer protein complex subunit alpha (xenin)